MAAWVTKTDQLQQILLLQELPFLRLIRVWKSLNFPQIYGTKIVKLFIPTMTWFNLGVTRLTLHG